MARSDFAISIVEALVDVLEPLEVALESPEAFAQLMIRMGWTIPADTEFLSSVATFMNTGPILSATRTLVAEQRLKVEVDDSEIETVLGAGVDMIKALHDLATRDGPGNVAFPLDQKEFWSTFPADLLQELFIAYLEEVQPAWFAVLYLLGIIEEKTVLANEAIGRLDHTKRVLEWSNLVTLVRAPTDLTSRVYGWGNDLLANKLLGRISVAMHAFRLPARVTLPSHRAVGDYFDPGPTLDDLRELEIPLFHDPLGEGAFGEIGVVTFPIPRPNDRTGRPFGLFVGPFLAGAAGTDIPLGGPFTLKLRGGFETEGAFGLEVRPGLVGAHLGAPTTTFDVGAELAIAPSEPMKLISSRTPPNVLLSDLSVGLELKGTTSDPELKLAFRTSKLTLQILPGAEDGVLAKVFGEKPLSVDLDGGIVWSSKNGLTVEGAGGLAFTLPVNLTIGPVHIREIRVALRADSGVELTLGITGELTLGPVVIVAQDVGVEVDLEPTQPGETGTFGDLDVDFGFKFPSGLGIAVNGGPVSGGGFLFLDPAQGRYSGSMELSVYGVGVKAFGLVETRLPSGAKGFSFAIVISAEFTPVQLGFGFTLVGVGGLIGINRGLNTQGLEEAVRTGSLDHLLFPRNPVRDAPAIIHDLASVFPSAPNHYVFGPMAKLGWGTPTLITGKLGIVLELPGPRLAVLGIVQMALPTSRAALLAINMAVAGLLDFPKRRFSINASLYDSQVVGFRISGDMAFRLGWGSEPNFALSVGGFNPSYQPPPEFPALRRVAVDLGINGNPSLTLSGYFALTPNTAQVGAAIDLHASGFGIHLDGHLGFDAMFVFSPFSFTADFAASVSVSFHGVGLGVGLHGTISGPTPWRVHAEACVSVLWWDACLPVDLTFGRNEAVQLPTIDPWFGRDDADESQKVLGLQEAIADTRSWSGGFPPGVHPVVSLADGVGSAEKPPIDPTGRAQLRQSVVPLNTPITRFGVFVPIDHTLFEIKSVAVITPSAPRQQNFRIETGSFPPALFKDMSAAERLSAQPYEPLPGGFTIAPDEVTISAHAEKLVEYENVLLDGGRRVPLARFPLSRRHLTAMLSRSAAALGGARRAGTERFVVPEARVPVTLGKDTFVIADSCSLVRSGVIAVEANSRTQAQLALEAHLAANPGAQSTLRVVAKAEARAA